MLNFNSEDEIIDFCVKIGIKEASHFHKDVNLSTDNVSFAATGALLTLAKIDCVQDVRVAELQDKIKRKIIDINEQNKIKHHDRFENLPVGLHE